MRDNRLNFVSNLFRSLILRIVRSDDDVEQVEMDERRKEDVLLRGRWEPDEAKESARREEDVAICMYRESVSRDVIEASSDSH